MKHFAFLAVSSLVLFSLSVCGLAAQDSEELSRGPDGGTEYFVDGIKVLPLAGKPFFGRSTTEWTRTLEDGTVVTTHLYAMVARDSQGRIFREVRSFVPGDSNEQSKLKAIRIFDPITHTRTQCNMARHQCIVTSYHAPTSFKPMPTGPFDDGKRNLERESLGSDSMEGVNVVGTRETLTISPGVVGNNQPMTVTREFWYSPELQVNLSITRNDPRIGKQFIQVGDLSASEPNPALFQVPSGFVVQGGSTKTQN